MFDNRLQPSNEPFIPSSYTTTEQAKPLFTLTAEEVEIVDGSLEFYLRYLKSCEDYCKEIHDAKTKIYTDRINTTDNLLTRIKQWQDEQANNSHS